MMTSHILQTALRVLLFLIIVLTCQQSNAQILNNWEKLYGDTTQTVPVKIKYTPFNDVVVLGNRQLGNGIYQGTLSILDAVTGNVKYAMSAQDSIQYNDIEFDLTTNQYIIVGQTTPVKIGAIWQDNQSVFTHVLHNGGGNYSVTQYYRSQLGREITEEILLHPNPHPGSNGQELYFTGRKNRPSATNPPPNPVDQHFIGSTDFSVNAGTNGIYLETLLTGDDEYDKGMFPMANGNIAVLGNDGNGNGILMEVDGGNGSFVHGAQFNDIIDLYCGYHNASSNQILLGGTHYATNEALLILYDRQNSQIITSVKIPELDNIEEIFRDQNGYFYAVGQRTDPIFNNRNTVIRFYIQYTHPIYYDLKLDYAKYFYDNETDYTRAHIYVDPVGSTLYYADGRLNNFNSFGDYDMAVAAFDLNMTSSSCIYPDSVTFVPWALNMGPLNPLLTNISDPVQSIHGAVDTLQMNCAPICSQVCPVDFTFSLNNCYTVDFTALPFGPSPYIYEWDIYNNNSIDYYTPNPTHDFGQAGNYIVCLNVIDASGNACAICKTVNVSADTEIPQIQCPPNIHVTVPACNRGANVILPTVIATDCGDTSVVTVTCSLPSNYFFPCGTIPVTCIATDDEGQQDSCTYFVTVECLCSSFDSLYIECGSTPDTYLFEARLNNLTGSGNTCSVPIFSNNQLGVNMIISSVNPLGNGNYFVQGSFTTQVCPMVTSFSLDAQLDCICPDQAPIQCFTSTSFTTPCCDSIYVNPINICSSDSMAIVTLGHWGTIKDIDRIDWFIQAGPCPSSPFGGAPFRSTLGYHDLQFIPSLFSNTQLCIYAEVYLGNDELPCTFLQTELIQIEICTPPACNISGGQSYCYTGTPFIPNPLTVSPQIANCNYDIFWYDENNNLIPSNTNLLTYQPSPLSLPSGDTTCGKNFIYRVELIGPCGPVSCSTTIRLDNSSAKFGNLYADPILPDPICYGRDAIIKYDPSCIAPNNTWSWSEFKTQTSPIWNLISTAGNKNKTYYTNQLYETTIFKVEKQNGVCPIQEKTLKINVKDDLSVSFTAVPIDICRNTGITLTAQITPCFPSTTLPCQCDYDIDWYRNGVLLATTNTTSTPAIFTYIDPLVLGDYSGYYYAVVKDNCCPATIQTNTQYIAPPPELYIQGACYICDILSPITLTGVIQYPPTSGTVSYQWYIVTASGDISLPGETNITLSTNQPGTYKLIAKWSSSCFIEAVITVTNCTNNILSQNTVRAIQGDIVNEGLNDGLILKSLGGFYYRLVAQSNGQITTYACPDPWTMNLIEISDADIITMQNKMGLIQYDENGLAHRIYVDDHGALSTTSSFAMNPKNTQVVNASLFVNNSENGMVCISDNGQYWRLSVSDDGQLKTELIRDY